MICFGGADDEGWYFVNNQFVGESHDWQAQPIFDAKNISTLATMSLPWAFTTALPRRLESQRERADRRPCDRRAVVAQPVQRPGANHRAIYEGCREIKLTATTDGLTPTTATVQTQPSAPRPSVP